MRCDIERDGATIDDWGQSGTPDWAASSQDVPCYVVTQTAREPVSNDRTVVVEDLRLYVNLGTDVVESDRVSNVTERGELLYSLLSIEAVLRYPTHLELLVREISG